jgi:hypothetical protein
VSFFLYFIYLLFILFLFIHFIPLFIFYFLFLNYFIVIRLLCVCFSHSREERQTRILEKQAEREEEKRLLTQRADSLKETDRLTGPSFLSSMSKDVYEGGSTASLQDRVSRGKHYIQRGDGNDNSYKR